MTRSELTTVDSVLSLPSSAWHSVRDRVGQLVAAEVTRQLAPVLEQQAAQVHRDFTVDLVLGAGRRVNRTLHRGHYATMLREISAITGQRDVDWVARRAYLALLDAELRGLGRAAGSTYNILGKLITPPLLGAPDGPILEIGTLFGMFSPLLVRQFRQSGSFRSLTVVDPFAGTQLQRQATTRSDQTGTPVTEEVARQNLVTLGVDPDELTVINGFSTEIAVQDVVGQRRYAVVVIDGDHSEDGVYADLRWVEEIALPGALVIMDDYGDQKWPGVERAVGRYRHDGGQLEMLGTVATSAYLRMPTGTA